MREEELEEPPLRLTVEDASGGRYRTTLAVRDGVPVELMIDWVLLAMALLSDSAMKLRVRQRATVYDEQADDEFHPPNIELRDLGQGAFSVHVLDGVQSAEGEWRRWGPYTEAIAGRLRTEMQAKIQELREKGVPPAALRATLKAILDRIGMAYPNYEEFGWPASVVRAFLSGPPRSDEGNPAHAPDCDCISCLLADGLDPEGLALHLAGIVNMTAEIAERVEQRPRVLANATVADRSSTHVEDANRGEVGPGVPHEEVGRILRLGDAPDHPPSGVRTMAEQLRWIIGNDYADEGTSSRLPLEALAAELEAAAEVAVYAEQGQPGGTAGPAAQPDPFADLLAEGAREQAGCQRYCREQPYTCRTWAENGTNTHPDTWCAGCLLAELLEHPDRLLALPEHVLVERPRLEALAHSLREVDASI